MESAPEVGVWLCHQRLRCHGLALCASLRRPNPVSAPSRRAGSPRPARRAAGRRSTAGDGRGTYVRLDASVPALERRRRAHQAAQQRTTPVTRACRERIHFREVCADSWTHELSA